MTGWLTKLHWMNETWLGIFLHKNEWMKLAFTLPWWPVAESIKLYFWCQLTRCKNFNLSEKPITVTFPKTCFRLSIGQMSCVDFWKYPTLYWRQKSSKTPAEKYCLVLTKARPTKRRTLIKLRKMRPRAERKLQNVAKSRPSYWSTRRRDWVWRA